jgi:hypothetical protein
VRHAITTSCWLIGRHHIGPAMRALRRVTARLFRQAGIDLDKP